MRSPRWLYLALSCMGSPLLHYPNQPLSQGLLLPCLMHSRQEKALQAFLGLQLLVIGSLQQQEGALSQPISKSSSDTAQSFILPSLPASLSPLMVFIPQL